MKKAKKAFLILAIILLFPLLNSCSSNIQSNTSLTIWKTNMDSTKIDKAIILFKNKYPNVDLIVEEYKVIDTTDYVENFSKKLATALMSGNGPDIIPLSAIEQSYDIVKMVNAGAFADMSEFYNSDTFFISGDYYENVLDTGVYDGKRYIFPENFIMPLALSSESALDQCNFDVSNCQNYNAFMGEASKICKNHIKNPQSPPLFSTSTALRLGIWSSGFELFDYANNKVLIADPAFYELSAFYKQIFNQIPNNAPTAYNWQSPDFSSAVLIDFSLQSFSDLLFAAQAMVDAGESPVLVPIRNNEGGFTVKLNGCIAVRNNSENKENAWEFIKLYLSEEVSSSTYTLGVPVSKIAMKGQLDEYLTKEALDDEFINTFISLHDEVYDGYYFSPGMSKLDKIMKDYWTDRKTFDECIRIATDTLNIYVSE